MALDALIVLIDGSGAIEPLRSGPEELRVIIDAALDDPSPEPEWFDNAVRALRPLTRKYIERVLREHGLELQDNEVTRGLGFFGDWKA
jgi:hypothetical protein